MHILVLPKLHQSAATLGLRRGSLTNAASINAAPASGQAFQNKTKHCHIASVCFSLTTRETGLPVHLQLLVLVDKLWNSELNWHGIRLC